MNSNGAIHIHPGEDIDDILGELRKADHATINKLTLYNLKISKELAKALLRFRKAHFEYQRRHGIGIKRLTLEVLGCTGCLDRVLEGFAKELQEDDDQHSEGIDQEQEQELILQHSHADHFDLSAFVALGIALSSNDAKQKTIVRLYQPVLSEAKIWAMSQGIRQSEHLKELDLSSCRFAPMTLNKVIHYLAEGFAHNQHLKCLQFADCDLNDDQIVCLLEGLHGHPAIETLNLAGNKCRSKGMAALATSFSSNRMQSSPNCGLCPLRLNLSNQHRRRHDASKQRQSDDRDEEEKGKILLNTAVVEAWKASTLFTNRLVSLNLSQNNLHDKDLEHLVTLMFTMEADDCYSTSIQELDISQNEITDAGIQILANTIKRCRRDREDHGRGFRCLNICGCPALTIQAFEALADATKMNVDVEEIYCTPPPSSPIISPTANRDLSSIEATVKSIQFYTMLNRGGRKVFGFDRADIVPPALWPLILDRVNHKINWGRWQVNETNAKINVLYHLLRQGPVLTESCQSMEHSQV